MKKSSLLLLLILAMVKLQSQDFLITFTGSGASATVDSVKVENLTQGTHMTMAGGNQLNLVEHLTGMEQIMAADDNHLHIFPNPSNGEVVLQFNAKVNASAEIALFDISGRVVVKTQAFLTMGLQSFRIRGLRCGIYTVWIKSRSKDYFGKIINQGSSESTASISFVGKASGDKGHGEMKSTTAIIQMQYTTGDRLKFTGKSGIYATVHMAVPTASQTIAFNFVECTDWDNNHYAVVQINDQLWMAENLKTTKFNDGQPIPNVTNNAAWGSLTSPGFCWGNNDPANKDEYGGLYNWFAVNTGKLAPTGWRVPTVDEFFALRDYLGGESVAGGKMKSTTKWFDPNTGSTNESGFSSFPVDYRNYDGWIFWDPGSMASYWSSTGVDNQNANGSRLANDRADFTIWSPGVDKKYGYSIRCIHD